MDEPLRIAPDVAPLEPGAVQEAAGTTSIHFQDLFYPEQAGLSGAPCLVLRDRGEAEEVMQEAFLKVWERGDRVQEMENPAGYLYRTALNLHRKRIRRAS